MADKTKIEWTEATWNPVTGCTKVSAGCKHCYAERDWARLSANPKTGYFGRAFTDVRCHPERLDQPLRWKKPRRIFVNSMSDLFHHDVPEEFIRSVFDVMAACPQHTFQILTKRAAHMQFLLWSELDWKPAPNVWLGVSVEDQAAADERIPLLLQTPAAVRWVSMEPLLGQVDLTSIAWPNKGGHRVDVLRAGYWNKAGCIACGPSAVLGEARGGFTNHSDMERLNWVVVGGESGPKARPMSPDWVRDLRDQCSAAGVPFLMKQWGEWIPMLGQVEGVPVRDKTTTPDGWVMGRAGKKAAGRLLDSVLHDGYPQEGGAA